MVIIINNTNRFVHSSLKNRHNTSEKHSVACDSIELIDLIDSESSSNSIDIQCDIVNKPFFKKCTGDLSEFSSTYSVELLYSDVSKAAILTFNQSNQVTHEKENETITPQKYQFQEFESISTSYDKTEKSKTLRTYSKKQPVVETLNPISPLTSTSVCFKGYQMISGTNGLHALTGVENA